VADSVDVDGVYVAQFGRKFLSAKDLDPKFLRANNLRTRICTG
jgi:hypothetical protein